MSSILWYSILYVRYLKGKQVSFRLFKVKRDLQNFLQKRPHCMWYLLRRQNFRPYTHNAYTMSKYLWKTKKCLGELSKEMALEIWTKSEKSRTLKVLKGSFIFFRKNILPSLLQSIQKFCEILQNQKSTNLHRKGIAMITNVILQKKSWFLISSGIFQKSWLILAKSYEISNSNFEKIRKNRGFQSVVFKRGQ